MPGSGFIAAVANTGKTVLTNRMADGLYYAVRYRNCITSVMERDFG